MCHFIAIYITVDAHTQSVHSLQPKRTMGSAKMVWGRKWYSDATAMILNTNHHLEADRNERGGG